MIEYITESDRLVHPRTGETELFLVRHGQTSANTEHRFAGSTDVPLDDLGRAQAMQVAARFGGIDLDAIVTSPLRRARYTAEKIGEIKRLPVTLLDGLREIDFGEAEGMTIEEILAAFPDLMPKLADLHDRTLRWPEGETRGGFHDRILNTLNEILEEHEHKSVAVVCHGGVIGSVLAHLEDGPRNDYVRYGVANCSISHMLVTAERTIIHAWNDFSHLDEVMSGALKIAAEHAEYLNAEEEQSS